MILGTVALQFCGLSILKWLHAKLSDCSGLNNYLYMLASLNSLITCLDVDSIT